MLGNMQKKTTEKLTMTSNDKHITIQTDFSTGLTRLDRQYNRTRTNEKKLKSPRFAFLKISASDYLTHLQSRTGRPSTQALQKSQILTTQKKVF